MESPHQVDMKNVVKSSKHFFWIFFYSRNSQWFAATARRDIFSKKRKKEKGFLVQIDIYSASIPGGIFENLGVHNDIETQGFACDPIKI